jgi:hypothetical protein
MSKTQKQIDEFFKVKQEQEQTLQPRSQMILNDEPLPSSKKKYQKTELDKVLEQFKGIDEWTDEKQTDWELKRKVESLEKQLGRVNTKKAELYTDNILLKREIEELKIKASSKSMAHICMQEDADTYYIQLEEYRKLQSAVHSDIEKVWMYDGSFPLNQISMEERAKLIERVFYTIANEWID